MLKLKDFYRNLIFSSFRKQEDLEREGLTDKEHGELSDTVYNFLRNFRKEEYEYMFGDHARVTVYPDRISVEEYCNHS